MDHVGARHASPLQENSDKIYFVKSVNGKNYYQGYAESSSWSEFKGLDSMYAWI
jgi:hypothetical protein